jgi:hypothetical protein
MTDQVVRTAKRKQQQKNTRTYCRCSPGFIGVNPVSQIADFVSEGSDCFVVDESEFLSSFQERKAT